MNHDVGIRVFSKERRTLQLIGRDCKKPIKHVVLREEERGTRGSKGGGTRKRSAMLALNQTGTPSLRKRQLKESA